MATSTPPAVDPKPPAAKLDPADAKATNGKAAEERADETSSPDKEAEGERARRPFSNTRADSPQAKGDRARTQGRTTVPPADGAGTSRWLVLSFVIAGLILAGRWYLQSRQAHTQAPVAEPAATPAAPAASEAAPAQTAAPAETATASATGAAAEASAAASAEATPPTTPPAGASASAAPDGTRVVIVKISPPGARLFYKGKPVGASPVTVELAPGEKRRSFEVGMPGWVTRRLVVDGTKPEVFIGLKPEK